MGCSWTGDDCLILGVPAKIVSVILVVLGLLCSCRQGCKSEDDDKDDCRVDTAQTLPTAQSVLPLPFAPVLEVEAPGDRAVITLSGKENDQIFPHGAMRQMSDGDGEIQKFEIEGDMKMILWSRHCCISSTMTGNKETLKGDDDIE